MKDKEIKIYSSNDYEVEICPFDGEACSRRRRCFGEVRDLGYDYFRKVLSLRVSLCARAPRTAFERLAKERLLRRIGEFDDLRRRLLELSRRDMK